MSTPEDVAARVAFLREAANYFRKRDTGGEDAAFWANVANAENCDKIADLLASHRATIERLERALREAIDTLKGLAKDNPWAEWVAVPMIVGDETVVSRLEAALTAREPGVTGKGEK
jgi:hypothetical protein